MTLAQCFAFEAIEEVQFAVTILGTGSGCREVGPPVNCAVEQRNHCVLPKKRTRPFVGIGSSSLVRGRLWQWEGVAEELNFGGWGVKLLGGWSGSC
ncbi:hypothetical protein SLA2020_390600 [Shorea laevis]